MTTIKQLPTPPSKNEKNKVQVILQDALDTHYDEVMIVGYKGDHMQVVWSGFSSVTEKVGALARLQHDLMSSGG